MVIRITARIVTTTLLLSVVSLAAGGQMAASARTATPCSAEFGSHLAAFCPPLCPHTGGDDSCAPRCPTTDARTDGGWRGTNCPCGVSDSRTSTGPSTGERCPCPTTEAQPTDPRAVSLSDETGDTCSCPPVEAQPADPRAVSLSDDGGSCLPPPVLPETPSALMLPASALVVAGGVVASVAWRKRRRSGVDLVDEAEVNGE